MSGETTSEKLSKSSYKFQSMKKNCPGNCIQMCCNRESIEVAQETNKRYYKDLEVTLKDYN